MRIALVIEFFDPLCGGASQWTIGFARYLLESGHTVLVVAFRSENHSLPLESYVLPHSHYPLERARRISRCIEDLKPDVVYDGGTGCSGTVLHPHAGSLFLSYQIAVSKLSLARRLRTSISPRGWYLRWSLRHVEKEQMARAERIIAVSERVRALLSKRHGLPESRFVVVPNGVDTARISPERLAQLRPKARRALDIRKETVFLLVAQSLFLKGADNAIRALGTLAREGAAVRLVIAGATSDPWWRRLAARCGVKDHVSFLGFVADIVPLYAAADAVVHPTRSDACSLATLEGMAAGLPVVTTLMNGAAERIRDGENGLLIGDPEDTRALASQMRRLLEPQERNRIGTAAREAAIQYSLRDNFSLVERILIEVAAQKSPNYTASLTPKNKPTTQHDEPSIA